MKGKNILVLDDDRIVLESCKRILEHEGFSVFLVSNVREAVEHLEKGYFDLLILDIKMPELDGMYLLEKIKTSSLSGIRAGFPVVVMSGYPTPDTVSESLSGGARYFLEKPFTPDELLTSIYISLKGEDNYGKEKDIGN